VRHLLRSRRHDRVEALADERPAVLLRHRRRPLDPRALLEPRALVLVAPALDPPEPHADAQDGQPLPRIETQRLHPMTSWSRAANAGNTSCQSPTMPTSAHPKMSASGSALTARIVPAPRTPT